MGTYQPRANNVDIPDKDDLAAETRNWSGRGVIPSEAARARRHMAKTTPAIVHVHEAYAAEWDRIERDHPQQVIDLLERIKGEYEVFLSELKPGTESYRYNEARIASLIVRIEEVKARVK